MRRYTITVSSFSAQYQRFRQLLIHHRQSKGITQIQLAKQLERPQSFVSKYENGERRLDLIEFLEIAKVLNINACKFIAELEKGGKP
jgi:transcriptional regulator with XRE-family HTH domain